jgi:hypothetical protein
VHYEVLVNNEPQDPEKFIGLARVIPAAVGLNLQTSGPDPDPTPAAR